jgi:hypothetical protein
MNFFDKQFINTSSLEKFFIKTDDVSLFKRYYRILTNQGPTWKDMLTNLTTIDMFYLYNNIFLGNYKNLIEYYKKLLLDDIKAN